MEKFHQTAYEIATLITKDYSTSFFSASCLFKPDIRKAIFAIYGFVRFADEIVDSFHGHNKAWLLKQFENDFYQAMEQGISLNPVLDAFQLTVKKYDIPNEYIQAFLKSMQDDLHKKQYDTQAELEAYIYGSADVIGLMCLKVFCYQDPEAFSHLRKHATKLGSAFQKVNFLRDLQEDISQLERCYFPCLHKEELTEKTKIQLIAEIESDFEHAYLGIKHLPIGAKLPVFVAFSYYKALLNKIKKTPAVHIRKKRIRISNISKCFIMLRASAYCKLNLI